MGAQRLTGTKILTALRAIVGAPVLLIFAVSVLGIVGFAIGIALCVIVLATCIAVKRISELNGVFYREN